MAKKKDKKDKKKQAKALGKSKGRNLGKIALGAFLAGAGIGHLTVLRDEFQAQVPSWVPADPDLVVLGSGAAEIGLGVSNLAAWRQPARSRVGALTAAFFVVIFPGNIAQYLERKDGFGLDTDGKRLIRLFFQPLLVAAALSTGETRKKR